MQLWNNFKAASLLKKGIVFFLMLVLSVTAWINIRGYTAGITLKTKVLSIGRDSLWSQLAMYGKERYMQAFSDDLLLAIAKAEGLRIEIAETGSNQLFSGLEGEYYDAILTTLTPHLLNPNAYLFSDPLYLFGPVLIVSKTSPLGSLAEMEGKVVAVKSGATAVFNVKCYPAIIFVAYDNVATVLDQVSLNRIDGVIIPALEAYNYIQGFYSDKLKVVTSPLTHEGIRLVTLNHGLGETLIQTFNAGLSQLKRDHVYQGLLKKWNLVVTEKEPVPELPENLH